MNIFINMGVSNNIFHFKVITFPNQIKYIKLEAD